MCTIAWSKKRKKKKIFYSAGPHCFYFLFILSNPIIHSLSFSLSLVHLSFLSSSTLSTSPPSSSSIRYGITCFFFFFFFFSFYQIQSHSLSLIHCHLSSQASQAHSLNVAGSTIVNIVGPVSLSQLRSPTHKARRRSESLTGKPMEIATDRSACLWILILSHHRSEIWDFFFFLAVDWWWWCWWWLWLWLWLYLMVGYIILLLWLYYFIVMFILFYYVKN